MIQCYGLAYITNFSISTCFICKYDFIPFNWILDLDLAALLQNGFLL